MKKQLFSIAALLAASFATAAGGMTFIEASFPGMPDHPNRAGTYWGWSYQTNLSSTQVPAPSLFSLLTATSTMNYMNFTTTTDGATNNPADPGVTGYRVYARRDPSIDFRLGSSIKAKLITASGWHDRFDSPVPGSMIGMQDARGYFFGIGFAQTSTPNERLVRIITNPFTGAGSEWIPIPLSNQYYNFTTGSGSHFDVELVIAGSRASILIAGRQMESAGGNVIIQDAGAPLTNLIFSHWINHGGVIVGDYSTTSSGRLDIVSLSYY